MHRAALPLVLVLALTAAGCGGQATGPSVWFVHATDPHLFDLPQPGEKPNLHQQRLVQRDFANLLAAAGSPAEAPARPAFLVLTGDLGLKALSKEAAPAGRAAGIKQIAEALRASPLKDVYYVLGNNDVCGEQAMGAAVDDAEETLGEINQQLGGQVVLHDLTSCYQKPMPSSIDGCTADVGAGYRLIGFPSYSFKTPPASDECAAQGPSEATRAGVAPAAKPGAAPAPAPRPGPAPASAPGTTVAAGGGTAASGIPATRDAQQKLQLATFLKLTAKAAADGKKVLVVTHTPELDDPYSEAQGLFAGKVIAGSQRPEWAKWSAWDVSPEIRQAWQQQVDSDLVAGVLAGHFHDSHREVYYPPYAWSAAAGGRARKDKFLLAPPLAIKLQDSSPYQARGFALVRLDPNRISRRLYWYDGHAFVPDPVTAGPARAALPRGSGGWLGASWSWLWGVGADQTGRLGRAAVVAIALLVAFLTVVQVWQIPPPDTATATPAVAAQAAAPGGGGATASATSKFGPFDSNLANTVLAGLLGMFGVTALNPLWSAGGFDAKLYYLLLFVIFFLTLLLLSALLRSVAEALRSRILLPTPAPSGLAGEWLQSAARRFWRWVLSLRTPLLVFADTFYHVIQGKNQLQTAIFDRSIRDLQLALTLTAEQTAKFVHRAVIHALECAGKKPRESHIRVNVSVLSDDRQSLYYVTWEPGSSSLGFSMKSVAWVAVRAGQARWWKSGYTPTTPRSTVELYGGPQLPPLQSTEPQIHLALADYFQDRGVIDYEAFMVLPIPWRRRDEGVTRLAGLHISFQTADLMDAIWQGLDDGAATPQPAYRSWTDLLRPAAACCKPDSAVKAGALAIQDEALQQVLEQALAVLAEGLRPFNEPIFKDYVRKRRETTV